MSSKQYYTDEDLQIMKIAKDSSNRGSNRTREIIAFAKEAKMKIIGVAYCISFIYQ